MLCPTAIVDDTDSTILKYARKPTFSILDTMLACFFRNSCGVVGDAAGWCVIGGFWNGRKGAPKLMASGKNERYYHLLFRNEVRTYERMKEVFPSLLGSAVPKFLLGWDNPGAKSVYAGQVMIVTESI